MAKYMWKATSNDGLFEDESEKTFDTQSECYHDMQNHALEKMKWNTNYKEGDFDDFLLVSENGVKKIGDGTCIGYEVQFYPNRIVHASYSGIYTYEIFRQCGESDVKWTVEGRFNGNSDYEVEQLKREFTNELRKAAQAFADKHNTNVVSLGLS